MNGLSTDSQLAFLCAPFLGFATGAGEGVPCLLSRIRACVSLCRLSACAPGLLPEEWTVPAARVDALWESAARRCDAPGLPLADRFRLCDALYALLRETGRMLADGRGTLCDAVLFGLMDRHAPSGSPLPGDEDATCACCRVLQSFFQPEPWEDDSWFRSLRATLSDWCASQQPDGSWEGLSFAQAWHRLEVLNRQSWLFRDVAFDRAVAIGCRRYQSAFRAAPITPDAACAYLEALQGGHLLSRDPIGEERAVRHLWNVVRDAGRSEETRLCVRAVLLEHQVLRRLDDLRAMRLSCSA